MNLPRAYAREIVEEGLKMDKTTYKNQQGFSLTAVIIFILVAGFVGTVCWLVYNRQQDKQQSVSSNQQVTTDSVESAADTTVKDINFSTTETHLTFEDRTEVGNYIIKDRIITIFVGSGSGQNFAEIKKIILQGNSLEIYVDANYCGSTKDLRPLNVSAQFKNTPPTTKANVNINATCGTKPTNSS